MEGLYKNKYRIKSSRLLLWNYSDDGYYFITICVKKHKCLFGKIENDEMILNKLGKIAVKYWLEIPKHFSNIVLDEFIVMPNHIHGIIEIKNNDDVKRGKHVMQNDNVNRGKDVMQNNNVKCGKYVIPNDNINHIKHGRDAINRVSTNGGITGKHNPMGKNTLGEIIRWYKGRSTFEIRKIYPDFQWQSRFYDHIIRTEESLYNIRNYIISNPGMWGKDRNNPEIGIK